MKGANKKLGEILIQEDALTQEQLEQALAEQQASGGFLGATLVRLGFIDEEELTNFLVKQCRIPYLKLSGFRINEKISSLIPPATCRRHQILPVDKLGNLLTVAMVNPLDLDALQAVKDAVPYRIKPIICSWHDFEHIFEEFYGHLSSEALSADADTDPEGPADGETGEATVLDPPPDPTAVAKAAAATQVAPGTPVLPPEPNLVRALTFDRFVVAEANTFTVAVAREIAERPGTDHNPLFLYGDPGLGKTHLVNAIGHAVQEQGDTPVCYLPAGLFSDELLAAIQFEVLDRFRGKYQQVGLLILDDVQFFAGRERVQEEFFHLFNLLQQRRQQIVVVSDVPPKQLKNLEQRLISRFEGGLVATLDAPDAAARLAILRQGANGGSPVPEGVLTMLAEAVPTNVRELQGGLKKLRAYSTLVDQEITEALAQEILKHLFAHAAAG